MSHFPLPPSGLTASILARTSGPACGRLRDLACDLVDGMLPHDDIGLVRGHLDHCLDCQRLVASLATIRLILPAFTRVDPGTGFTASVLARTRTAQPFPVRPPDRLVAGWTRFMRRPRAALEAAYLATAAGLLLTQVPLPGSQHRAGAGIVTLVRTGSRASLAGVARGQAWSTRARAPNPVRPHLAEPFWSSLWSRFTQRISLAWLDLVKTAREARARIWREPPQPVVGSTEPSAAPARPAP